MGQLPAARPLEMVNVRLRHLRQAAPDPKRKLRLGEADIQERKSEGREQPRREASLSTDRLGIMFAVPLYD